MDDLSNKMSRLKTHKVHVDFIAPTAPDGPVYPRFYTLTHSDMTGDLFLTVGPRISYEQIRGWWTRFMRDEVVAEWKTIENAISLHVHCHVSGGMAIGPAGWRDRIFRKELPLVLEALRFGDRMLFDAHPELENAPIIVHFHSSNRCYRRTEEWGVPTDY